MLGLCDVYRGFQRQSECDTNIYKIMLTAWLSAYLSN
jgi:hypothetical protein